MRLYADTSWWLGYKCRSDTQHHSALRLFEREPEAEVLWTPWQRVEVFNGFSQAERAGLMRKGESQQTIRILEQEVRIGYWPHVEFDWTDAVRTAGELRAEHSLKRVVRAMDLFHLAIAIEVGADALLSFDTDQIALAKAAGLMVFNLAEGT
ncbi:MAG TPA: PIN domain-containing protein [Verrucomicrobiae bacterium]|nr:PIN domain-containing protein [Verrucomicrobiae bacterium]